jgi:hypothetical protein
LSFKINLRDTASARVKAVMEAMEPRNLNAVGMRAAVNITRAYLFQINSERANKLGGARTNFYAQAARGTQGELRPEGFVIGINQVGMGQRYHGGTITARNAKYLTIPVTAQAYGKRAREFQDLEFIRGKDGKAVLVKKGTGEVFYSLVPSVHQKPDPSVLPSEERYREGVAGAVEVYLDRVIERSRN